MAFGYIYITTNLVNGRIYIGQSTNYCDKYLGSGINITRAISKYGRQNFSKKILRQCDSQTDLDLWERLYIKRFNSTDHEIGYNIAIGSVNKFSTNPATLPSVKKKMSENHFSRKMTLEEKRLYYKKMEEKSPIPTLHKTDHQKFLHYSKLGGAVRKKELQKTVYANNLTTGEQGMFPSAFDAETELRSLGYSKVDRMNITACCRGERKTSGGWKFSYNKDIQ